MLIPVAGSLLVLAACATPPAATPPGAPVEPGMSVDLSPAAPGEIVATGTVLQVDGEPARFCHAVLESYPPQCGGPELTGWEWPDDEMWESANGVTWGGYAVFANWDGELLTSTYPPVPLALYDPVAAEPDPRQDPGNPGHSDEAELLAIQDDINSLETVLVAGSWPENGYLFVTVYYDDGGIQAYFDVEYGADTVAVQSLFRDVPHES